MKNIAIALSFLCLIYSANAQSPERNKAPIKTNVINTSPSSTSEVAERRTRARALLISLSTDARSFRDQTLRAKAWVMLECAKILPNTDRDRSLQLIDLAIDEARRLEPLDPALPRALFAVANAIKAIDRARVWEATFDAVKAANSADGFTGEDGELIVKFQSKGQASLRNKPVEDFDLNGIFSYLAIENYDRAVELARGFQAEGPRAIATIAIAEAILHPKSGAASQ